MEKFEDLEKTLKIAWDKLQRAAKSRNDPMRTPVLASFDGKRIHQRTIVLRKVNKLKTGLYFFSDLRAPKIQHLKNDAQVNAVFYDARKKLQIEMHGTAQIHTQNELSGSFWKQINTYGRSSYAAQMAPGSTLTHADQNYLPEAWSTDWEAQQTDIFYPNFAVIEMKVVEIDVLHLHSEGHQRALFTKEENAKDWKQEWIVP